MASYLILELLFFLAFIVAPIGASYFETPKVILAELGISVLLFWLIVKEKLTIKNFFTLKFLGFYILFLLTLIQLLFLKDIHFFGNVFRMQGVFLLWILIVFSLISSYFKLSKLSTALLIELLIAQTVAAIFIVNNQNSRLIGTLGEPNSFAGYLLFLYPFVYFKSKKIMRLFALFLIFTLIFFSGSRSGLIGFLIENLFLLLINLKLSIKKTSIIILSIMVLSLILPFIEGGSWYENRSEIWKTAFVAGMESPLIGHGFGNIENPLKKASFNLNNNIQYQFIDSSHNIFLDYFVQGGLVGLIILILILSQVFKNFVVFNKQLELTCIFGLLTILMFNPVSVVILIEFWWLVGQGIKYS